MKHIELTHDEGVAVVAMSRGKVNALNIELITELQSTFESLESDDAVRSAVVTGWGHFFSFGLDVPEIISYTESECERFLTAFTSLYTQMYGFSKPLIAAMNGHAVAGGCMLALACDYRVMASGRARTGLNEATFGASVFAGIVEILREVVGGQRAERIVLNGELYVADKAQELGLVDHVCSPEDVLPEDKLAAAEWMTSDAAAFSAIKRLARGPIIERMKAAEPDSVRRFVELWYSESTREQIKKITIR